MDFVAALDRALRIFLALTNTVERMVVCVKQLLICALHLFCVCFGSVIDNLQGINAVSYGR